MTEPVEALAVVGKGQLDRRIVHDALGLRGGVGVVDRHAYRAHCGQCEIENAPFETGGGKDGHRVALGDAEREDFPERLPEHLFGPPELTGEAGGVRPDRAERGHVRVRQQEQQRELALVGKLTDFGVVPDARRYLTVFHHLSSRMASGAALPSPPKPQVFLQLFRSLAPRDETPAKRQRRADDAGLAPDWAGQGVPSAGAQPRAGSRKRALSHLRNG